MWIIETSSATTSIKQYIFKGKKKIKVGRIATCDFVFDDKSVSREHAELFIQNQKLYLKDLKSKFGTKLNQNLIHFEELKELNDGDEIIFGGIQSKIKVILASWKFCGSRLDRYDKDILMKCCKNIGATTTEIPESATHIITNKFTATLKCLIAIAMIKVLVSIEWIKMLDIEGLDLILIPNQNEYFPVTSSNFQIDNSVSRSLLLKNYHIIFLYDTDMQYKCLIESMSGVVYTIFDNVESKLENMKMPTNCSHICIFLDDQLGKKPDIQQTYRNFTIQWLKLGNLAASVIENKPPILLNNLSSKVSSQYNHLSQRNLASQVAAYSQNVSQNLCKVNNKIYNDKDLLKSISVNNHLNDSSNIQEINKVDIKTTKPDIHPSLPVKVGKRQRDDEVEEFDMFKEESLHESNLALKKPKIDNGNDYDSKPNDALPMQTIEKPKMSTAKVNKSNKLSENKFIPTIPEETAKYPDSIAMKTPAKSIEYLDQHNNDEWINSSRKSINLSSDYKIHFDKTKNEAMNSINEEDEVVYVQPDVILRVLVHSSKPNHQEYERASSSLRDVRKFRKNIIRKLTDTIVSSSLMEKVLPRESEREIQLRREASEERVKHDLADLLFR